ncbi:MAG: cation:proton antiporter [Bacteroidales bacterium]|jgi:Kef-type K+ transport system membrane component KefB/nucleotide-binding universal stress UspA family protein|nr:cation:proton antiporter [Bacteroidales bacterium]
MKTLLSISFTLPLQNPVLIFAVILAIILFAPILLNRIKIPHLIGLIIAGVMIGPNGFYLIEKSNVELFGKVGLLYIMFLAGLEIDMIEFKKNSMKSAVFGFYTFVIPMGLGFLGGYYLLQFSILNSILLASIFASHTLIAYPILGKFGITKNRAVNIAVGGTVITDTLALLVLAVIVKMTTGEINNMFWVLLGSSILIFGCIVIFIFPIIGRWFFKHNSDNISQYIFVLAMVFLGAVIAEAAGIEAIIGAFLVGLSLNRLIPHTSPLMNRIEFVGNALFIPFFLIGVGMIVNYKAFIKDWETLKVAGIMIVIATTAKFLAAWFTQKTFRFTRDERRLIFGLSNAQAAATLAAVLIGYNIELTQETINSLGLEGFFDPGKLLNENILNGAILMILFTCTMASMVAQKGAQNIALLNTSEEESEKDELQEKILVPVNSLETAEEMMNLALAVKSKTNKQGVFALTVVDTNEPDSIADKSAKKILSITTNTASAADVILKELLRYDLNVVNGITNVVKEHKITDLILGLEKNKGLSNNFIGNLTEGILTKSNTTTLIYKPFQPISTIKRHLIIVPDRAEKEIGFPFWLLKIWNIARNTGTKLVFYSSEQTLKYIKEVNKKHPLECEFIVFDDWDDFLILSRDVRQDDNLVLVLSRKERPSFNANMTKIPNYLNKYFKNTNFILIYPMQAGVDDDSHDALKNPSVLVDPLEKLDDLGKIITNLFKKKLK